MPSWNEIRHKGDWAGKHQYTGGLTTHGNQSIGQAYKGPSRDWKTGWTTVRHLAPQWGRDDYRRRGQASMDPFVTTGGMRIAEQWDSGEGQWSEKDWGEFQHIDFGAYNRDPYYSSAQRGMGIGGQGFKSIQDILDAEGYYSGEWQANQKAAREAAEKARLEEEARKEAERKAREEANRPKHIDVGQSPSPVGGIGTVQPVPGIGGSQPPITIQPYPLPGGGGGVGAGGMSPIQGVSGHDFLNSPQYAQERAKWEQQLKDRDAVHQQSIADLQSQWGTQQQGYQQQLTNRDAAHAQAIANLQSQWGAQEKTYAQQLADLGFRSQNELADLRSSLTNQFSQDRAAQDRAYQTRLSDLTSQWGDQRSQYDTRISDLTSGWDAQRADYSRQLGGLQGQIGGLQGQLSGYEGQIGGLQSQISGYQEREQAFKEAALQDAQRSRVAASYGPGSGAGAKGVATGKWLQPQRQRLASGGARGTFGRQGMRISGLNI